MNRALNVAAVLVAAVAYVVFGLGAVLHGASHGYGHLSGFDGAEGQGAAVLAAAGPSPAPATLN